MGMGNYPCSADQIEESFVEEQCPILLGELKAVINELDISFDTMAQYLDSASGQDYMENDGFSEDDQKKLKEVFEKLQKQFEEKTKLTLDVTYSVSDEEADRGCDVTGGLWCVGGVYERTPAGKKFADKIAQVGWTVFG